jgi:aerobic carbon-monoxide dehydrogenase small subunit
MRLELTVNGAARELETQGLRRLLDVLRLDLGLVGTKEGCGEGECGACTVSMNGEIVCACLVPAAQAQGASIVTIEGISLPNGALDPVQRCLAESGGAQCGICTPGMVLAGCDFVARVRSAGATPDRDAIRLAIAGNLCRCTGYQKIVDAIAEACVMVDAAAAPRAGGRVAP